MRSHRHPCGAVRVGLGVAAIAALGACDDAPPPTEPAVAVSAPAVSAAAIAPRSGDAIDFGDVVGRLLPSFKDQVIAAELHARLDEFTAAYQTGDDVAAQRAITRAEALLPRIGAHSANAGSIRLALARAHALLRSVPADVVSESADVP